MFLKYAVTFLIKRHLTEVYAVPKCAHTNYAITNVQISHAAGTGSPQYPYRCSPLNLDHLTI